MYTVPNPHFIRYFIIRFLSSSRPTPIQAIVRRISFNEMRRQHGWGSDANSHAKISNASLIDTSAP